MPEHEFQYPEVNENPRTYEQMKRDIESGQEAPSADELAARRLKGQEERAEARRQELLGRVDDDRRREIEEKLQQRDAA